MIAITRSITIVSTCYTLSFIPLNTWWGILIWAVLILIVALGVFILYKNMERIQKWAKTQAEKRSKKRK